MSKNIWEEFEEKHARESFEKSKSGNILFIKDKNSVKNWEICLSPWENLLSSNYWKNWEKKIQECQNYKELDFYVWRLVALIDFIHENTIKGRSGQPDPDINVVSQLIHQEEKRLQNISSEDWRKEDKFSGTGLRKITDPKEMVKIFGDLDEALIKGEIIERLDKPISYRGWTKEQLKDEVKKLTSLISELEKTENLDQMQIMNRNSIIQSLERQLNQSKASLNFISNNKPFPYLPIIGTIGLVFLLGGFIIYHQIRKNKIKKPYAKEQFLLPRITEK